MLFCCVGGSLCGPRGGGVKEIDGGGGGKAESDRPGASGKICSSAAWAEVWTTSACIVSRMALSMSGGRGRNVSLAGLGALLSASTVSKWESRCVGVSCTATRRAPADTPRDCAAEPSFTRCTTVRSRTFSTVIPISFESIVTRRSIGCSESVVKSSHSGMFFAHDFILYSPPLASGRALSGLIWAWLRSVMFRALISPTAT
mmetsp:Transcript_28803/g.64375  ORF Transcript_28803/g.64375 Transcript_28803/m.64375 type:complete len:202 (+) Transcript_28803:286-891(+)